MYFGVEMFLVCIYMNMCDMILEMIFKRLGCVGIVDEIGKLFGIFIDGDLRCYIDIDVSDKIVVDVMMVKLKIIW